MNCRLCGIESLDFGENLCQTCAFKEIDRHLDNTGRNITIATYILGFSIVLMMINFIIKMVLQVGLIH